NIAGRAQITAAPLASPPPLLLLVTSVVLVTVVASSSSPISSASSPLRASVVFSALLPCRFAFLVISFHLPCSGHHALTLTVAFLVRAATSPPPRLHRTSASHLLHPSFVFASPFLLCLIFPAGGFLMCHSSGPREFGFESL
ncbi:hypothetical protein S83_001480, partial [Arachis hypogaea]